MKTVDEHRPETCKPIGEILSLVGDRWTVLLLAALGDRRMRFGELHRAIDGISQRMLTVTVRSLERDGLLIRTVYPTIPPRVEYELSDLGRSLKDALAPVGAWVSANQQSIEASRRQFDQKAQENDSSRHLSNGK
ncbi:helix-turn-helix domain-containing protein [Hyphomicrobium sp.]|uniref:winged helix-turn-helix transcriptional regulator n=1 Tax=Hyphomicrobium sp. TaxID=82 RepID=UPI0025BFE789|nr:helix-turn-helix domain-containing protein [Hyphomicrobium sp.]MCC7251214.1 helix-turn-helix transcriptional regulator [Hyphomicrobium sp.]